MFKKLKTKTTKAIEISTVTISGVIAGVIGLLILRFYNFRCDCWSYRKMQRFEEFPFKM
jgi:hypothetical protein